MAVYPSSVGICVNEGGGKQLINSDLRIKERQLGFDRQLGVKTLLLYFMHNDEYFRSWFYYRIGPARAALVSWIRPGSKIFSISYTTRIGSSALFAHPYATMLNAESIGDNFSFIHCTTLGFKNGKRPSIGNNVSLGANVTIIGGVTIGDNVTIGAGSVVVKDVPANSVAVGNPARVIKRINTPPAIRLIIISMKEIITPPPLCN